MGSEKIEILLTDTCSVYKLYFFISKEIIPADNIIIPGMGLLEFHPIVLEEFESDVATFHLEKNLTPRPKKRGYPSFFDDVGEVTFPKIERFIKDNLTSLSLANLRDDGFKAKRIVFDDYRKQLQKEWREENIFQGSNKSTSAPSPEDYLLLYDAIKNSVDLVTNDEILLEIAKHFLSVKSKHVHMAEHILKGVFKNDPRLKSKIEECIANLGGLGEKFEPSIVFG